MAHCWFCEKVKGKRACPARGGALICTKCCGANRHVAIRCPPECVYLHGAHDAKWSSESREKEAARFFARAAGLEESPAELYLFLHYLLAFSRNPLSALDDGELVEVLSAAASTLETRARGVLYSHPTERAHLQPLAEWTVRLLSARGGIEGAPKVSDAEALAALRALSESVEEHRREATERYLSKVERLFTRPGASEAPPRLPGDLEEPPSQLIVTP